MELATDVRWKGSEEFTGQFLATNKKRGWGSDSKSMLQLMLGPLQRANSQALDLLCGRSALQEGVGPAQFGREQRSSGTLDLLGGSSSLQDTTAFVELDDDIALPCDWEKCLDLKRGSVYFVNRSEEAKSCPDRGKRVLSGLHNSYPALPSRSASGNDWTRLSSSKKPRILDLNSQEVGELPTKRCNVDLALRLALPGSSFCGSRGQLAAELSLPERSCNFGTTSCVSRIPTTSSSSSRSIDSHLNSNCHTDMDGPVFSVSTEGKDADPGSSTMMTAGCSKCFMFVLLSSADPKCPRCGSCALLDLRQGNKDGTL